MTEMSQANSLEAVRMAVDRAFRGVRSPGRVTITPCPCADCRRLYISLAVDPSTDWRDIPAEVIAAHHDKLPLLSPEAFRYYLPAFMTYALAHWGSSLVWEFTAYALTPEERLGPGEAEWWRERFARFTPEQMQAVYAYLDLSLVDTEDWLMWTRADRGKRALAEYTSKGQQTGARLTKRCT